MERKKEGTRSKKPKNKKVLPQPLESMQLITVNVIKRNKTEIIWTGRHVTLVRSSLLIVRN